MNHSNQVRPNSRSYWPVAIAAFFTVAIIGCVSFVAFCILNPTDLVAADYYEQEVRYQGHLERLERTRTVSGATSVQHNPDLKTVTVQLPVGHLNSLKDGTIHLYRPSAASLDQRIVLQPDANGRQSIDASRLTPGLWRIRVSWSADGQEYFLDNKLTL